MRIAFKKKYILPVSVFTLIVIAAFTFNYTTRKDLSQYSVSNKSIEFALNVGIVSHMYKNDTGPINDIFYIAKNSIDGGDAFVDFWNYRTNNACNNYIDKNINEYTKKLLHHPKGSKATKKELTEYEAKLMSDFKYNINLCKQSYIYDNWNEILTTVRNRKNSIIRKSRFLSI